MIARSYAEVLMKQHRPQDAALILEAATREPVKAYHSIVESLSAWVDARSQLVQVLRESGQPDAADKVAAPLRKMLALADPEFQPALRLK